MIMEHTYNCKTANHIIAECCECKSTNILYDSHHDLIFCKNCGSVLKENIKITLSYSQELDRKKQFARYLGYD